MSQEVYNSPNQNNEEVDLIKLLNYFKNGIKSIFKLIWKLVELIIWFIILLKRNWILVISLMVIGAVYGKFIRPMLSGGTSMKSYEMVVKANPISNYELYALSNEINNQGAQNSNPNEEGVALAKSLGIAKMEQEAIPRLDDVVNSYFENIETATLRGFDTDTLFYQSFDLKDHKSNMEKTDYSFQKIKLKVKSDLSPQNIQSRMIDYLNMLPGVKREQESKLLALNVLENELKSSIRGIDTMFIARAEANRNPNQSGIDQTVVNTASRGNVEADLLRYKEIFIKRLYGTMRMKADTEKGIQVISNLRSVGNSSLWENQMLKYALYGLVLASSIILLIQFNKYLEQYSSRRN